MKLYVASRASIPERSAMWRDLKDRGANIISTWIYEAGENDTGCFKELWTRIDKEIAECDRLVLYVEASDFPLKGALIEVGMALARNKPVMVVLVNVELDLRSLKPLGSWAAHELVTFTNSVEFAVFG